MYTHMCILIFVLLLSMHVTKSAEDRKVALPALGQVACAHVTPIVSKEHQTVISIAVKYRMQSSCNLALIT